MKPLVVALLSSYALSGCVSTAKMYVPANKAMYQLHDVSGINPLSWNKPISFGQWRTVETSDSGRLDSSINIGSGRLKGSYHSRTLTTNDYISASCSGLIVGLSYKDVELDPSLGNLPLLRCIFSGTSEAVFELKQNKLNSITGELVNGLTSYRIESEHLYQDASIPSAIPLGFTIHDQNNALWTIDKVNLGTVIEWTNLPAKEKNLFAALSMVLLVTDFESLLWE
ncbi:hypothetical protein [Rheinheimera fenheensis]|uniref:hypothetical protein n=1 Tax=Rheinheimera fenheensis TaxID=3152295 RepID=UPI00325DD2BA